ncbi:MAG: hypothetical protein ABSC89_06950 [Verrucomicrobiota bacterium]
MKGYWAEKADDEDIDLLCEQLKNSSLQPVFTPSENRYMRQMWVTGLSLAPKNTQARAKAALTGLLKEEKDLQVKETILLRLARK